MLNIELSPRADSLLRLIGMTEGMDYDAYVIIYGRPRLVRDFQEWGITLKAETITSICGAINITNTTPDVEQHSMNC